MELSERVLAGEARAIARAISLVENDETGGPALIRALFRRTGRAYVAGVTGPPGAGKSTLVDRLTGELRKRNMTVGVLAVDPSSPFSGGAVLGDRLRMQAHATDAGVFIRSMATRGHLGGLARATNDAVLVLDAAGFDLVIVETVGVGQDEVDIIRTADVSIVALVPGAGDDVQALKAGVMEIADIFVVNKADREGADRLAGEIAANLSLGTFKEGEWRPPILKTIATTGAGVDDLAETIDRFRRESEPTRLGRRQLRSDYQVRELVSRRFMEHLEREVLNPGEFQALVQRVVMRDIDPYAAADALLVRAGEKAPPGPARPA